MNNGEWQRDETGCYYRKLGEHCIEYAPEYTFAHPGQNKEKEERERKEAQEREARRHTGRDCPFKSGLNAECLTECALYGNKACALSMEEVPPDKDTSGGDCPIYRKKCNGKCALYFNGCGLINIVKGLKAGKEN